MPTVIQGITFYRINEIAQALQIDHQTVRAYIKRGKLKAHRIGRPLLVTEEDLKAFIKDFSRVSPGQ